jgi:bacillithiol biosynthesis cysteine-adding enzyme BshC
MLRSPMPERTVELITYEALHQPLSPLFLDYLGGRDGVLPFLGKGFDLPATGQAAERALTLSRPVGEVAHALARQQEMRNAASAAERAHRLLEPGAVAVVTGQQAGLFGGPLFVLFKAITCLEVARRLEAARGRPVVPVFWVASDDHDFAEIRSVSVIDGTGAIRTLRYAPHVEPVGQPAWAIELDDTVTGLVDDLGRSLPPSLGRDAVLELVAAAYRPGETLSGAFARLLSALLPDLVVLDPRDDVLRRLAVPTLARELRESSPTSRLAIESGTALLAAGYHQQVPVRPGFLNLFAVVDGQRRALGLGNGTVEVRGTGERWPKEVAARRLEQDPLPWSPGALLRPLVQDALLPTAAYVGGPAEIAYHAQIGSSYAHFGIPRPALVPRPSLTLVEPAQARALDAERLSLSDLVADPETLLSRWVLADYPDVEAAFARTREAIEREMGGVEQALGGHDTTLRGAAAAARGRALHQVEGLHEKALRALKKRDQGRAERLRRTRDALVPGGSLQERGLGLVGPVARHGPGLAAFLTERLDPFARAHQVIRL